MGNEQVGQTRQEKVVPEEWPRHPIDYTRIRIFHNPLALLWWCISLALFLDVGRQVSLRWHCDAAAACQLFTPLCLSVTLCSSFAFLL
ncbi:hypothetical protein QQF64_020786 [Cirrhinus molitorella]|uniref:Uncharacterized protein n=1 Tax=Cirrhinus molitorella TaxID=172907 RepID=A0ABR3LCG8_9TELE